MEWTKVFVETTSLGTEIVAGVLISNGILGMEVIDPGERVRHLIETKRVWDYADEALMTIASDDTHVVFYVTKDAAGDALIDNVRNELEPFKSEPDYGSMKLFLESADDAAWLNEWKKFFKPIHVGRVVIVPEWEEYESSDGEVIFTIDPGSAFGTGQHETTKLCIMALQDLVRPGDAVLDIGCGSGVLSIISLLLGADSVFACDIDPSGAIAATKRNTALNPVDASRIQIHAGDAVSDSELLAKISEKKYDIIVINIVADVIMSLLPIVRDLLKLNSVFILSGIIDERLQDVVDTCKENDISVREEKLLDGWACVVAKPNAPSWLFPFEDAWVV